MAQLYEVVLRCPVTRNTLETGIRTSGRDVLTSGIYSDGRFNCRFCRQFHLFEGNAFVRPAADIAGADLWRPNP